MRKEIQQLEGILLSVKKVNQMISDSRDKIIDSLIDDILITVEAVNEFVFGSKIICDYKVYEMLQEYKKNDLSKQKIVEEIIRWCGLISDKAEAMRNKNNHVDYEFYMFMNYIEMVPKEIILEDMKNNFQSIKQYGDEIYHYTIGCYRQYDFWGAINPYEGIWDLCYDRLNQLKNHREDFIWLYEALEDFRSKMVLNGILHYWVEYDYHIIKKIKDNNYKSYFDLDIVKADPDRKSVV